MPHQLIHLPRQPAGLAVAAALAIRAITIAPASAQTVPTTTLTTPEVTLTEPLSAVRGLRELSDGRVVVTDAIEQVVRLIDLGAGTTREIGHRGGGPGEFGMAGPLFGVRGDTTWMMDLLNRRFLVLLPDGRLADSTIRLEGPSGLPVAPGGVDQQGRIYFSLLGTFGPGLEQYTSRGAAPLLRWDPAREQMDTLGVVHFPAVQAERAAAGQVRVRIGGGRHPYDGADGWAVTADGRVAIARYQDYHVEWLTPGAAPVVGPTVPYTAVKIGAAEKEAWAEQVARGRMVITTNGQTRTMRRPRPNIDEQTWPEVMPPFFASNVHVTPEGEVWVERARPANEPQRTFDVFDGHARRVRQMVLPADRSLAGFGRGVLYAVRTDEDGLQWLERYRR